MSFDATVTLKISRKPFYSMLSIRRGIGDTSDGEEMPSSSENTGETSTGLDPPNVIGKTVIVKVQLPMGESNCILVYNKTKDLTCQIPSDGQPMEYARLEKKIRDSGWMGMKGYFMAEVGDDTLKIKVAEILANQPW